MKAYDEVKRNYRISPKANDIKAVLMSKSKSFRFLHYTILKNYYFILIYIYKICIYHKYQYYSLLNYF